MLIGKKRKNIEIATWREMQLEIERLRREVDDTKAMAARAFKKMYFGQAGSNNAEFSPDGTLRLYEDATDWEDQNFDGESTKPNTILQTFGSCDA